MPYSSFSVKYSYSLGTHYVEFDHTNLYIKLKSNNSTVKTIALAGGVDMRVNNSCFQTGTINGMNGSFNRTIDFNLTTACLIYEDLGTKIIGTDDLNDAGVVKYNYIIGNANCPIRVIKSISTEIVTITCPCDQPDCSGLNSSYSETY